MKRRRKRRRVHEQTYLLQPWQFLKVYDQKSNYHQRCSMYSSHTVTTSSKEAACKQPVRCPRLVIQESFQPYNFAAAADRASCPARRKPRHDRQLFTFYCLDTNGISAIDDSSLTLQPSSRNPTRISFVGAFVC